MLQLVVALNLFLIFILGVSFIDALITHKNRDDNTFIPFLLVLFVLIGFGLFALSNFVYGGM